MFSFSRQSKQATTQIVDEIQKIVYAYLKPLGFRKHGRVMHRFVEGDISQVVELQNGCPQKGVTGLLWVQLGIRVPECEERTFTPSEPKKYYHDYHCNIRAELTEYIHGKSHPYDLRSKPETIGGDIVEQLEEHVMPVFELLSSREAILAHRREHRRFDSLNHRLIELEEAMIYGRAGDKPKAEEVFIRYYLRKLEQYRHELEHGRQVYLRRFEKMMYKSTATGKLEEVEAKESGYVTVFNASDGHLRVLRELAAKLEIALPEM